MKTRRRDAGFSLAALIMFLTIASIFIAAAVPVYQMQAKRELEEELIFRGGEYTRAIQKYQRKFGTYPTSIDQLLSTNNLRFLRRAYKDPITGKDFRLITLNPDGSLNGSKVFTQNVNNQPLFGNTTTGVQGQSPFQSQSPFGAQTSQNQQQTAGGLTSNSPGGAGIGGFNPQGGQQQGQSGQQQGLPQGQQAMPIQQMPIQQMQTSSPGLSNTFGSSGQRVGGGGIVGVASDSDKQSIKIYNNRQKYNEWEFVALQNQQGQINPQANPAGGQRQNNPFGSSTGNSPLPGTPGGSPFGTGQQAPRNPFGAGTMPSPIPSK